MPCLRLRNSSTGEERSVEIGKPFKREASEVVLGRDPNCSGEVEKIEVKILEQPIVSSNGNSTVHNVYSELDKALPSGLGNWVQKMAAPIAKAIGKKSCAPCEARRLTYNAFGQMKLKHGFVGAVRIMAELSALSGSKPNEVVKKLKEYLSE